MTIRILIFMLVLPLPGCIVSWDHDHAYSRKAFDRDDADQIVRGFTTRDWVVETFGEPDSRADQQDGGELWRYNNRGNRDVRLLLFPLLDVDLETDQRETLSIRIEDEVVTDYWIINDER